MWLHFVFISASHADPCQDTGVGFSLLSPQPLVQPLFPAGLLVQVGPGASNEKKEEA